MRRMKKVFISHKSKDAQWARRLAFDLRNRGIDTWLDIWDMPPGEPLTDAMERGIRESDVMLLLLSRSSVKSIETGKGGLAFEVHIGEERSFSERNFRIIGILIESCKPPLKLRNRLGRWLDFRKKRDYEERLDELARWLKGESVAPDPRGDTYDLLSLSLRWLTHRLKDRDWIIPLQNFRDQNDNISEFIYKRFPEKRSNSSKKPEIMKFPWGPTLGFKPDIIGAVTLPKTYMYGWIIGMVHPRMIFDDDVIRAHYYVQAANAFLGYVFWDEKNGMSKEAFTALTTVGGRYEGINEEGEDVPKGIQYVMYSRAFDRFIDDFEAARIHRITFQDKYF